MSGTGSALDELVVPSSISLVELVAHQNMAVYETSPSQEYFSTSTVTSCEPCEPCIIYMPNCEQGMQSRVLLCIAMCLEL
jgi:hypothetical protein